MARITYIEKEDASPHVLEIYEKRLMGKPRNSQKALALNPKILENFLEFFSSVGRVLDRRIYELVYIRVSMINGANYCMQHHLAASRKIGLTEEDWLALRSPGNHPFSEKESAALAFAEKLTRRPAEVGDSDFATLRKYFSEDEILDLDMTVALANLTNRVTGPLGLELEMEEVEV